MDNPSLLLLNSDVETLHAVDYKCDCGAIAVVFWPTVPGKQPRPYCRLCCDHAKEKLSVALGFSSPLPT